MPISETGGNPQRVAVAMSGGVDSSVAAALLKEQGYDVIGISMRVWDPATFFAERGGGAPPSPLSDAVSNARLIADQLRIPFYEVNFEEEFRRIVVDDFIGEYCHGRTPNPCARCNRFIKFGLLLDKALALGADMLATGHYARIQRDGEGFFRLLKGADPKKDQSYFLFDLSQEQLSRSIFPLGGMTKEDVRALASRLGLRLADTGESQEICFIPDDDYVRFLEGCSAARDLSGEIVTAEGTVIGRHNGTHRYTVGQRRGLGIAWTEPLYVLGIDTARNLVVVGTRQQLFCSGLLAKDPNWIMPAPAGEFTATCKIRYRHQPVPCRVIPREGNRVEVRFLEPEKSVTPGQAVVFYDNDRVLGGGWIEESL
jgi:tRNA-specific 2-thiouridylase